MEEPRGECVCFSGHRRLYDPVEKLRNAVESVLSRLFETGVHMRRRGGLRPFVRGNRIKTRGTGRAPSSRHGDSLPGAGEVFFAPGPHSLRTAVRRGGMRDGLRPLHALVHAETQSIYGGSCRISPLLPAGARGRNLSDPRLCGDEESADSGPVREEHA